MRLPLLSLAISTILAFSIVAGASNALGKGQPFPVVTSKQYGYSLQQSREGIPILISKMFFNVNNVTQNVAVILDVRKADISIQLVWQEVTALPRNIAEASISWTPQIAGEYEIRSFTVSNSVNPEVLEELASYKFNVMSNADFEALYSDRPAHFSILRADPVATSSATEEVTFNEKQYLGNGLNTWIGDISVSNNGLYLTGSTELPPIGESFSADAYNQLMYFIASDDGGLTFAPMQYLVNNTRTLTFASNPLVHAVNDTLVYVSWLQQDYNEDEVKLVVGKSFDGGKTFVNTSFDYGGVIIGALDMAVSRDGRSLYTVRTEVYHDAEPGLSTIEFVKITDYAKTFDPNQVVASHTGTYNVGCPQIEVQEADGDSGYNKVYLSWLERHEDESTKLFFTASYDDGTTFGPRAVVRGAYPDGGECPTLISHGNDVYLFWTETKLIYKPEDPSEILVGDTNLFFAVSRDSGQSFEPPVNLSEGIGAFTMETAILVSDGRIYVAWRDTIPKISEGQVNFYGNAEVIITRSLDGGRTFEKPVNLSNNPTGSYAPKISVHGDNVYVIWLEGEFHSNEAKVSLRVSGDGGRTYGSIAENIVGSISEPVSRPTLLTSPDGVKVYILWSELTDEYMVNIHASTGEQ